MKNILYGRTFITNFVCLSFNDEGTQNGCEKEKRETLLSNLSLFPDTKPFYHLGLGGSDKGWNGVTQMKYSKPIKIKSPYLTGWKKFNYKNPTPFIGVADYKLDKDGNNTVTLDFESPPREITITKRMVYESLKQGHVDTRKNTFIYYFPLDVFNSPQR